MKFTSLVTICIILLFSSCKKNNGCVSGEVTKAIIKGCGADTTWGIMVDTKIYPADFTDSIPAEFQHVGLKICVQYDTVIYPFECPCCYDGPFARIMSIQKAE
ncbi:MAG: hypothetical protein ABJB05_15520 [Parafilimonas sp.]